MTKCVGFRYDRAANMLGIKGGLVTLLKQDFPLVIGIYCLAHRLELAYRDTISKGKTMKI